MRNKKKVLWVFLLMCSCHHRDGLMKMNERPDDIRNLPVCEPLYNNILSLFPESRNNFAKYPALFDASIRQEIALVNEAEIFVTFVGERASRSNALGWYTYDSGGQPNVNSNYTQQIIFPHISNSVLTAGDTRQLSLGRFKAGTVIGFYLVIGGWDAKNGVVDFSKAIFYTDRSLNKNSAQQSVIFQEKDCNDIIVAYEDTNVAAADLDFDDVLFKVSDNNEQRVSVSFDMSLIPSL